MTDVQMPSPVLTSDDPLLRHIARLAGATWTPAGELENCNGLLVEDLKSACYQARDELAGLTAIQTGDIIHADRDGWSQDTLVADQTDQVLDLDPDRSQPVFGVFAEAGATLDAWDTDVRYIYGYSYDMHLAAAIFCDMWASALKTQFDFNDGTGNYARSQKYQQVRDTERSQRSKARVQVVVLERADTSRAPGNIHEWFQRLGNG